MKKIIIIFTILFLAGCNNQKKSAKQEKTENEVVIKNENTDLILTQKEKDIWNAKFVDINAFTNNQLELTEITKSKYETGAIYYVIEFSNASTVNDKEITSQFKLEYGVKNNLAYPYRFVVDTENREDIPDVYTLVSISSFLNYHDISLDGDILKQFTNIVANQKGSTETYTQTDDGVIVVGSIGTHNLSIHYMDFKNGIEIN